MLYGEVVIDLTSRWADRTYTYSVPPQLAEQLSPGWAVQVEFGEKLRTAYLIRLHSQTPEFEVKAILGALGSAPVWPEELLQLAEWMTELYLCTHSEAMQCVVPGPVLRRLLRPPKRLRASKPLVGLGEVTAPHRLNPLQQAALDQLSQGGKFLLQGVTGSGKTEVYLNAIEHQLSLGRGAIVLVPEVSLTPQAIDRYRGRMGDRVSVLHSQLSEQQRATHWLDLREGRTQVALGTRSAVFAPVHNLGLIIIDEEHDSSYKQENAPRYHTRQVADWRVNWHQGSLLLGSATPCLETYAAARSGRLTHLRLPGRARLQDLPKVELIDLRIHRPRNRDDLSPPLVQALQDTLARDQQAVLLYNRRGFARYLQCYECGQVEGCPHCSIALTLHKHNQTLQCHYCGYTQKWPDCCSNCGGLRLRDQGSGTERLAEEVQRHFPSARCLRMDRDTTSKQGSHQQLLSQFAEGGADILLGTQMVAKGLDFPRVTLVGVVGAEQGLHMPDFRASERVLQLLIQVAGRAGRGHHAGRVLLQVVDSENSLFEFARHHNYEGFLESELKLRRQLSYPPYARLARLLITGPKPDKVESTTTKLATWLREHYPRLDVLGPSPCPIEKIQDQHRWHLILKAHRVKELVEILRNALRHCRVGPGQRWTLDIDPQSLL